jgi:lipoate-protein ligase A
MALDQTLLELAERDGVGFLRLYRWEPACLSFGRHEPATRRYRRDRIAELGLDVVRRPTGGRAVWHAGELTYAVAAPATVFGTLAQTYLRIHRSLARALELLGARPALAPAPARQPSVSAGACFGSAAGGEVLVSDRKVVGSAQLRQGTAFLQHGSVLLAGAQGLVAEVSIEPLETSMETSLAEALGRPVSFEWAADAVAHAARDWEGDWRTIERGDSILERAAPAADVFRSDGWTWLR